MCSSLQFPADLVSLIDEILDGKLLVLRGVNEYLRQKGRLEQSDFNGHSLRCEIEIRIEKPAMSKNQDGRF